MKGTVHSKNMRRVVGRILDANEPPLSFCDGGEIWIIGISVYYFLIGPQIFLEWTLLRGASPTLLDINGLVRRLTHEAQLVVNHDM